MAVGLEQTSILLIDDDRQVRQNMGVYLEDSGYEVHTADNGTSGIEQFVELDPALVLCDLRMPDIDGLELIRSFQRERPGTPIIVISGAAQIQDVVEALRLGATDYLVKPITDFAVFDHAIQAALEKQQLTEENLRYKQELEAANQELEANLKALKEDHEAGRQAQLQLLPAPESQFYEYRFSHRIIPSKILSGDFLDYFSIDDDHIGFYVADIQGHGTASAFVTMMLKSLINQPIRQYRNHEEDTILHPGKLLKQLNQDILSANIGKYMTLFYGVINRQEQTLTYSMGGHFPKPILRNGGELNVLDEDGFPIGLFSWASYEQHSIRIEDDFVLTMFSDGLLDVLDLPSIEAKQDYLGSLCLSDELSLNYLLRQLKLQSSSQPPDDITLFIIQKVLSSVV